MLRVYYRDEPIGYTEEYNIQRAFWAQSLVAGSPDTFLLLQYPPPFAIGKSGKPGKTFFSKVT